MMAFHWKVGIKFYDIRCAKWSIFLCNILCNTKSNRHVWHLSFHFQIRLRSHTMEGFWSDVTSCKPSPSNITLSSRLEDIVIFSHAIRLWSDETFALLFDTTIRFNVGQMIFASASLAKFFFGGLCINTGSVVVCVCSAGTFETGCFERRA